MKTISFILILALSLSLRLMISDKTFLGVLFGELSVMAIWVLIKQVDQVKTNFLPEVTALFLAISPWDIVLTNQSWKISFTILISILGVSIIVKFFRKIKWFYLWIIIFIIFTSQLLRPFNLGLQNTQVPIWTTDEQRREHGVNYNDLLVKSVHNKVINYSLSYLDHYSEYFSGSFLFILGDEDFNKKVPGFGLMYLADILFVGLGLLKIIKNPKGWGVIMVWLAVAPINSAFSFQPPNAGTAALMIIPLISISSLGIVELFGTFFGPLKL